MDTSTLLHNTTPEKLTEGIVKRFEEKLNQLKEAFQPKEPTEYMTRNEVKDMLHVDLSTVHNWTKKGKLKAYGIGNRIYYKRDEVEQSITPIEVV